MSDAIETTKSQDLPLDSLVVENFRAFRQLTIEKLGRVNLITGRNSVGKSSLLEALLLYANRASAPILRSILLAREEITLRRFDPYVLDTTDSIDTNHIEVLFFGRPELSDIDATIQIGLRNDATKSLQINLSWYAMEEQKNFPHLSSSPRKVAANDANASPYLEVQQNGFTNIESLVNLFDTRLPQFNMRLFQVRPTSTLLPNRYMGVQGLSSTQIATYWDHIALTEWEDKSVDALRLINPHIQRVSFVSSEEESRSPNRVPVVKIQGLTRPIPLKSLGDGINRLFGIVLALIDSQNGLMLIDEIENGLHYSKQKEVWRFLFQLTKLFNVQVFATTHSWDCIEAFQAAAGEDDDPQSAVLVRLERNGDDVVSTVFDERRLAIVTRQGIEVR